jgi:hypothetical protein
VGFCPLVPELRHPVQPRALALPGHGSEVSGMSKPQTAYTYEVYLRGQFRFKAVGLAEATLWCVLGYDILILERKG